VDAAILVRRPWGAGVLPAELGARDVEGQHLTVVGGGAQEDVGADGVVVGGAIGEDEDTGADDVLQLGVDFLDG
jgi:hypothetical protein